VVPWDGDGRSNEQRELFLARSSRSSGHCCILWTILFVARCALLHLVQVARAAHVAEDCCLADETSNVSTVEHADQFTQAGHSGHVYCDCSGRQRL
jgi:hypothetical protein